MKSQVSWTTEEETLLKNIGGSKLLHELAELLPRHTALAIRTKRKRLGVVLSAEHISLVASRNRSLLDPDKLCKSDHSLRLSDLDNFTFQLLIGSLLGDGCVKKNGHNKNFNVRNLIFNEMHVYPQEPYTEWKAGFLSIFHPRIHTKRRKTNCKRGWTIKCELSTVSHPIFTFLRDKFYASRSRCDKSILPMDILSQLDLFGLMIWYLDDGYLGRPKSGIDKKGRKMKPSPHIVAKGYSYKQLTNLTIALNEKYDLSLYVKKNKHRDGINKTVRIPARDRSRIFDQWRAWAIEYQLPECMYYKLNMHSAELLEQEAKDNRYLDGRACGSTRG